jgi:hypothetical protein
VEHDDPALEGLLRELARAPEGDDAFVRRVLARVEPRRPFRALAFVAAVALAAAFGFVLEPPPTGRLGFTRQACLLPEARTLRLLAKDGDRFLLLGELPVGARARVPAGVPILVQALGDDGLALWTDRDAVRVRPGEDRAPSGGAVFAFDRSSARPVEFARDVKPILDQHCTGCHAERELLAAAAPFDARHSALLAQSHGMLPEGQRRQLALWIDLGAARP